MGIAYFFNSIVSFADVSGTKELQLNHFSELTVNV